MTEYRFVPALDLTDLHEVEKIVAAVGYHPSISGFKVGFSLGLTHGLPKVVETIRRHSDRPIIYDHQKAGTDIPATGTLFAHTMFDAGVDSAILFPQAGPETLAAWVEALFNRGLGVIVGGVMTHGAYLRSEGGYLCDDGVLDLYRRAREMGVKEFVLPLTKPAEARRMVEQAGLQDAEIYSPGFGAQGGEVRAFPFVARHHLIVGRALLAADDPRRWLDETAATLAEAP
jgi:orotidine-5'-phosphate decarboxylase